MTRAAVYLVMDMINDLVHPDGPNGAKGFGPQVQQTQVVEYTATALAKARAAGVRVGYVRIGFSPDYHQCPPDSPRFAPARAAGLFKLGTWGTEVHPLLAPAPGDFDIIKHRVSPFYGTALEPILRANGIRRLFLSGVSTNGVVQAAMREGHDRDYACVLIEDCCCAITGEEHRESINTLRGFGTVTNVADVSFST